MSTYDFKHSIKDSLTNFSLLSTSKVLVQLLHLAILALIARKLGAESFGKLNVFLMVAQFIFLITVKWTATGFTRFSITHMIENKPISHIFWARNLIAAGLLMLIVFGTVLQKDAIANYMGLPPSSLLLLFGYYLGLLVADYTYQIAEITTSFKALSVIQVVEKMVLFLLLCLFSTHIFSIIYITIIAVVGSRIWLFVPVWRRLTYPLRTSNDECVALLRFSLPLLFVSIGGFVFGWIDIVIIKFFMTIEKVGVYSLAYNGLNAVESVVLLMATVLRPIFISLVANEKKDIIAAFGRRILPQIQFIWGLAVIVLGWVSTWMIPLVFGRDFAPSSPVFVILLISLNFTVFNTIVQSIFIGMSRVGTVARISISATLINLILDLILVPLMGIMGGAIATLFSCLWISLWYYKALNKTVPLQIGAPFLIVIVIASQALGLVLTNTMGTGIALSACSLIICFVISKKMDLFQRSDKAIYDRLALPAVARGVLGWLCDFYEKPKRNKTI